MAKEQNGMLCILIQDMKIKLKLTIEKAVKTRGMKTYITHLVVPMEEVVETTKTWKKKIRQRKYFQVMY